MRVHALRYCWQLLRSFLFLLSLASVGGLPAAKANLVFLDGSPGLLPNTAGQKITLLMVGSDFYTDSNVYLKINGGVGPAPRVTHVFGDTGADVTPSLLDDTIWHGGNGGIALGRLGTYPGGSGLEMLTFYVAPLLVPRNDSGVYLELTISTVGVPVGSYLLDFTGTNLYNGLTDDGLFNPIPAPLEISNFTLSIGVDASLAPATQISLGNAVAPSTPTDLPSALQVSNTGFLANVLNVEAANITGPNADLFEVLGGFTSVDLLSGADPLDLGLRFLGATAPGTYTAQLTVYFNNGPPLSYPLAVTVVPEPSSYLLALLGVAAVVIVRVRCNARHAAV